MDYVIQILGPLLAGTAVTLQVFLLTLLLSVPLGLVLALLRVSRFRVASGIVNGYIWLMRGTPLMLQMLFIYFALPFVPVIGVRLPDFPAAIVAFVLNYAAYFAEIFRAGIQSIDAGNTRRPGCSASPTADHAPHRPAAGGQAHPAADEQRDHHPGQGHLADLRPGDERPLARRAGDRPARFHDHALRRRRRFLPPDDAAPDAGDSSYLESDMPSTTNDARRRRR
jgi:His/Glu/Gln/Arg/opine family amino acid ABC transporter permease subunit